MLEFGRDVSSSSSSSSSSSWHHGFLSFLVIPLCCVLSSEAKRSGCFHFCRDCFNSLLCSWLLCCIFVFTS
jgi:hypothetical protein